MYAGVLHSLKPTIALPDGSVDRYLPLVSRILATFGSSSESAAGSLAAWVGEIAAWNQRIDLTAARDERELCDLMIADAALLSQHIPPDARVVDDAKEAEAILEFTQEAREKDILSLTGTGRVREFQLRYRVGFRVHDGRGGQYVPQSTIQLTRDVTFNDAEVLAKEAEEQLLFRDMQTDMVQQIMRRLAAAERLKPKVP